ncbi:hypothetical protein BESB_010400 [Besnoitia besnoiti]|uniref:Autophagy protein 5 n=1 Tax=Besnoitia besnoiti TaxID=94643 RepID=A0A2A9MJH8_BESBE|nr:hypothetical protein BESB_010400 [Besnoitia besnoiti]PFH38698.1 hypothetical protein BESB_010400 [Besnoitia besnoiti]
MASDSEKNGDGLREQASAMSVRADDEADREQGYASVSEGVESENEDSGCSPPAFEARRFRRAQGADSHEGALPAQGSGAAALDEGGEGKRAPGSRSRAAPATPHPHANVNREDENMCRTAEAPMDFSSRVSGCRDRAGPRAGPAGGSAGASARGRPGSSSACASSRGFCEDCFSSQDAARCWGCRRSPRSPPPREEPRRVAVPRESSLARLGGSLRLSLLKSGMPVRISLDSSEVVSLQPPAPLYLFLLRASYLPQAVNACVNHFRVFVRPGVAHHAASAPAPSFSFLGYPLDWRLPVGVSFDLLASGAQPVLPSAATRPRGGRSRRRQPHDAHEREKKDVDCRPQMVQLEKKGVAAAYGALHARRDGEGGGQRALEEVKDLSPRRHSRRPHSPYAAEDADLISVCQPEACGLTATLPWALTFHFHSSPSSVARQLAPSSAFARNSGEKEDPLPSSLSHRDACEAEGSAEKRPAASARAQGCKAPGLPLLLPPSVSPPYEGWASFESLFLNNLRQASYMLTGSAAAFHRLSKADELNVLNAFRSSDFAAYFDAVAPLEGDDPTRPLRPADGSRGARGGASDPRSGRAGSDLEGEAQARGRGRSAQERRGGAEACDAREGQDSAATASCRGEEGAGLRREDAGRGRKRRQDRGSMQRLPVRLHFVTRGADERRESECWGDDSESDGAGDGARGASSSWSAFRAKSRSSEGVPLITSMLIAAPVFARESEQGARSAASEARGDPSSVPSREDREARSMRASSLAASEGASEQGGHEDEARAEAVSDAEARQAVERDRRGVSPLQRSSEVSSSHAEDSSHPDAMAFYTLGDLLHSTVAQLFPKKTWRRLPQAPGDRGRTRPREREAVSRADRSEVEASLATARERERERGKAKAEHDARLETPASRRRGLRRQRGGRRERWREGADLTGGSDSEAGSVEEGGVRSELEESEILTLHSGYRSRGCRVFVQGIEPLLDTPLYWLWRHAACTDLFLHVVVVLPPTAAAPPRGGDRSE